jgi:large repetitive protein
LSKIGLNPSHGRRFFAFGLATSSFMLPHQAAAHGAWLGNGTFDFNAATVSLLQSNVNAGLGGFQTGDFITVEAAFPVIVNGTLSGPGGYVTFYIPAGTQVSGAWIIDAVGSPIPARTATSALSGEGTNMGWGPLGQKAFVTGVIGWNPLTLPSGCTDTSLGVAYTAANCTSSMAYVYGDTGLFYSTRADTAMFASGATTILLTNGYQTSPSSNLPWPSVGGAGNARVHNKWDAVQTNAFGASAIIANGFSTAEETLINSNGRGSTPHNAGSPVAGPDSGLPWDRYASTGPWNRISYSGSCFAGGISNKAANGVGSVLPTSPAVTTVNSVSACTPSLAGTTMSDLSPLTPLANAVRFAVGGITNGETHRVRVRLKVIDANLLSVANFEGHGGDSTQGAKASNDNPWRYWVAGIATAPLSNARLPVKKSIVAVNGAAYTGTTILPGSTIRYRVTYANGFAQAQTNVAISDVLPSQFLAVSNYVVVSGPNILPASVSAGIINFATIPTLLPGKGGAVEFDVATNALTGQTVTNTGRINSTQLSALQTSIVGVNVSSALPLTITKASAAYFDPVNGTTNPKMIPGALVHYTLAVGNPSPLIINSDSLSISDVTPPGLTLHVADIGAVNSGPVVFNDGAPISALSFSFVSLASATDDIDFSNDSGLTWGYIPTPDPNGDDANVSAIRVRPKGVMASTSSFSLGLRYRVN